MPIFEYKAFNRLGKTERGMVEAESTKSARQKLKKSGLMVTEIHEKSSTHSATKASIPFVGNRVGSKDMALMTRQLASLVRANIPLVEALTAVMDQTDRDKLKIVLSEVREDVNEGSSLAKALGKHPKIFDHVYINMVEAGENSGTLGLVLIKLADLKDAQMRLKNKVVSGMTYPVLMMLVAIGLLIAIFTFVIPKMTEIFSSMNKPIPGTTKVLMFISDVIVNWWHLLALVAFILFLWFRRYIKTEKGRLRWDAFKLNIAIFGPLNRMIAVARFSGTMSTLLGSGVPILMSMSIARNLVGNVHIASAIDEARENITEGQSIADPLKRSGQFPPMVIHMISIGEKTGELPEMLRNVSETYEEQISSRIDGLTALLEPAMIIGMGGVVAFIVMSIFIPLLEVSNLN